MALPEGTRLGPYEILAPLGAGGMGEVYRAKDTRLDRTVAIKVLPSHLSASPELQRRLEREAKAISQLSHPHICTLHDVGREGETDFLVMEYLEGETLAHRLEKGPLPLEQALRTASEIADALDKAHRQGVIHRDLKPGNIMLTKSGAKLLDFGLAKLRDAGSVEDVAAESVLPTEARPLTEEGKIVGTYPYMAPEQLEGEKADARTDTFAFGAVLYEMVTGQRAFEGKSRASLIAAILSSEPRPISELQPMTPPLLDRVVKRCLAKDPDERWQSAADLADELRWIAEAGAQTGQLAAGHGLRRSWKPWARAVAAVALVGLATTTGYHLRGPEGTPPGEGALRRFAVDLPDGDPVATFLALSRDGSHVVYMGRRSGQPAQLYHRALDELKTVPLPGTEEAIYPFFSPDGSWVGFHSEGKLKKVSLVEAGPALTICEVSEAWGASWGPGGDIVLGSPNSGLFKVAAGGGAPTPLTTPGPDEKSHRWPWVLPDGETVLFTIWTTGEFDDARIGSLSLESGEWRVLLDGGSDPQFSRTGHVLYVRSGTVMAVPFDPGDVSVVGEAVPVIENVLTDVTGLAAYGLSDDGTLAYMPAQAGPLANSTLVWVDRQGRREPLLPERRGFCQPRFSRDGNLLALAAIGADGQANLGLWTFETSRGLLTSILPGETAVWPVWAPDGQHVAFVSDRSGQWNVHWARADGSGEVEQLTVSEDTRQAPTSFSHHGDLLFEQGPIGDRDIWVLPADGPREARRLMATRFNERGAQYSPDGRWVAFTSNRSGQDEVYVAPYAGDGGLVTISKDGGREPVWSRDGTELFYRNGDRMMVAAVQMGPPFHAGTPRLLFEGAFSYGFIDWPFNYDIAPDGERFIMVEEPGSAATQLQVVLNWFEELKRKVPTN